MKTKYYIDYIVENTGLSLNAYYQVVRRRDEAILYANEEIENCFAFCFVQGINKDDCVIL